jgi:hypothetical protein
MKDLFFILIIFSILLIPHIVKTKEINSNYIDSIEFVAKDTSIVQDTVVVTLNVYDIDYKYEEDSTKINIFKVKYLENNIIVNMTIDSKLDFWFFYSPKEIQILDTIQFYPNY